MTRVLEINGEKTLESCQTTQKEEVEKTINK